MRRVRVFAGLVLAVAVLGLGAPAQATGDEDPGPCDEIVYPEVETAVVPVGVRCIEEVAPATATSPTCENLLAGAIVIPGEFGDGIIYVLDGEPVRPGVYPVSPGEYHVEAVPQRGYEFDDSVEVTEWHLVVEEPGDCTGPPGPPGEPGAPGAPGVPGQPGPAVVVTAPPATPVAVQPDFTG